MSWGAAALVHVLGLAAIILYVPPDKPPELDEVPIDMSMPAPPPKPPEVKVQQVVIKPPDIKQPIFRPLVQIKPLPASPTDMPPPPIPPAPPAPPSPPPSPPAPPQEGPPPSYVVKLFSHLARYKRYPRSAQSQHEQGVAYLRFTMDRQGHVLSYKLDRSSGHADLDAEVLSMIQRAQPLPELPAGMPETIEIAIPVEFSLH